MKTAYPNTITVRLGRRGFLFKPPAGRYARAWDALRAEHPELDGARITQSGHLHVQIERTMGSGSERIAIVMRVARAFGAPLQVYPSSWHDGAGTVTWALFTYHGVNVSVETAVCSCHPDAVAA